MAEEPRPVRIGPGEGETIEEPAGGREAGMEIVGPPPAVSDPV